MQILQCKEWLNQDPNFSVTDNKLDVIKEGLVDPIPKKLDSLQIDRFIIWAVRTLKEK